MDVDTRGTCGSDKITCHAHEGTWHPSTKGFVPSVTPSGAGSFPEQRLVTWRGNKISPELACVAGGFYGWLTRKPGTRVKTSSEAAGKWGEGNEKPRGEAAR